MNAIRVDLIPVGQFEEISIYAPKWKDKFFTLVEHGKSIKCDAETMKNIPPNIESELNKRAYFAQSVKGDHDWYYLSPREGHHYADASEEA